MTAHNVKFLIIAALQAPSPDNSQPCRFTWDGQYLSVSYDHERISGATFAANDPATLLSVGGVIENLVQAADSAGLRTDLQQPPENGYESGTYHKLRFTPNLPELEAKSPEDQPLLQRHTNRFPFKREKLPNELADWIAREHEQDAQARVIATPENIRRIARLVRDASEIRFQTREVHDWLSKSLRFSPKEVDRGDGLDVGTMDLPPGGGMFLKFVSDWRRMSFLNRFGAYKLMSVIDSAPVGRAPALVAISSPLGDRQIIAAGRLLTRIWIRLNAAGVAVHPYYVIPDQLVRLQQNRVPEALYAQARELARNTDELFELESGSQLRMLLRVGFPKKKPIRSRRLPVEKVFTDIS